MFKYLKSAFFFTPPIPGIGRVPWNILGLVCLGILGVANPGFWLLGAGLEATYLFALSSNRRFQRLIDSEESRTLEKTTEQQTQSLVARLGLAARGRYQALAQKRARILELGQDEQSLQINEQALTQQANQQALTQLSWAYLKLLIAQQTLQSPESRVNEQLIKEQSAKLEKELEDANLPHSLRESKTATLGILKKRIQILSHRGQSLAEIESDLARIEAQMDLLVENSALRGRTEAMNIDIEIASTVLEGEIFGDAEETVSRIDQQLKRAEPLRASA